MALIDGRGYKNLQILKKQTHLHLGLLKGESILSKLKFLGELLF